MRQTDRQIWFESFQKIPRQKCVSKIIRAQTIWAKIIGHYMFWQLFGEICESNCFNWIWSHLTAKSNKKFLFSFYFNIIFSKKEVKLQKGSLEHNCFCSVCQHHPPCWISCYLGCIIPPHLYFSTTSVLFFFLNRILVDFLGLDLLFDLIESSFSGRIFKRLMCQFQVWIFWRLLKCISVKFQNYTNLAPPFVTQNPQNLI